MKKFNVKPLGAIISSLIMAAATQSVLAQEADAGAKDEAVEEITVTGFAKSIQTAIETKRKADTVVQAISAEDIGGLPDKSIADSLSRLPGVTVTRSSGQAGTIQVRGMGEGFVFSTINGREQVSPNGTRAMEFSQFPSELINSVEVYMSPKASLIEGGVAGTVELKTVNALAMKEDQKIHIGLRGNFNDEASNLYDTDPHGKRITVSFQQKLLDDTLGITLGYARLDQPKAAAQFENFNYETSTTLLAPSGNKARISDGFQLMQEAGNEIRDGYMVAAQYEPNENLAIESDVFYSKFDSMSTQRGFRVQPLKNAKAYNLSYVGDNITGGTFVGKKDVGAGFDMQVANDDSSTSYDVLSGGLNVKWTEEALTVSGDLSHSEASGFQQTGLTRSHLYKEGPSTIANPEGWVRQDDQQVNYQLDGINLPSIKFSQDYTDLTSLRMTTYEQYPRINDDKVDAIRFDAKYELDMPYIASVEGGIRMANRNHQDRRQVFVYGGGAGLSTDLSLPITKYTSEVVNWKGDFSRFPSFLAIDGKAIIEIADGQGLVKASNVNYDGTANANAYDAKGNLIPREIRAGARWGEGRSWSMTERANIQEDVKSIFVQANLATTVYDRDLTGNAGLRYIHTDQSNLALVNVNGDVTKGAVKICDDFGDCDSNYAYARLGTSYGDFLPSLNLNYHLDDENQVRFALARVLSRAPINKLENFSGGSVDANNANGPTFNYGSSTSPTLKPFIADQIDISYEHYMAETNGSYSIAAYRREIKSFIQDGSIEKFDFAGNGFPIPATYPVNKGGVITEEPVVNGTYSFAANNGEGGYIQGLELSYTQTFTFLPSYWSGLGFSGSTSFVSSKISFPNTLDDKPGASLPFPGLVERSANFTLFYTYEAFETRLSTTYQGSFVGEARGINIDRIIYAPEMVMDYQATYKFDNGADVLFSIGNLTNEPNRSYMIDEAYTRKLNWFGRTYSLGVNYTF